jgi:hypothetical protein
MCNYGLDGDQKEAILDGISAITLRIVSLEKTIEFNRMQISSETAKTLENGKFYERHRKALDEAFSMVEQLKKSKIELQRILEGWRDGV